ncbi:luc7-like protein 3 [Drosophila serrata]|uniref:luc7-like protein 3 n=1 Tax=Drosophila serrata TaxID=7274 RepID=UPI000A1D2B30|nr:luc7-like protein 3 [Drosophila serrata]
MSAKYALIFAMAALCCLVATTEAAAQRSRVLSSRRDSELVAKEESDLAGQEQEKEQEIERQEQEEDRNELEGRSEDGAVDNRQSKDTTTNDKDTIVRPNKDDARARRIVRAGRRGGRRGRRSGRRGGRRGGRRAGRRSGRRRGGRRGGRGARRRTSIKRRSGKGNRG